MVQQLVAVKQDKRDKLAHNLLDSYRTTDSIKKFFSSFKADAYTISANTTSEHPHAEMLLDLALALKKRKRMAIVYMTSPHSFPHDDFDALCRACSLNPDRVLADSMCVRYLATQQMMVSLTASPDMTNHEHDVLRTIRLKRTEQLKVDLGISISQETHFAEGIHDIDGTTLPLLEITGNATVSAVEYAGWAGERHNNMESKSQWSLVSTALVLTFEVVTTGKIQANKPVRFLELEDQTLPCLVLVNNGGQRRPFQPLLVQAGW